MDRSSRQKINKETQALKDTVDQMNLIDIYTAFHPKAAGAHGTCSTTDHKLDHKISAGKFKETEIVSIMFSHYNATK